MKKLFALDQLVISVLPVITIAIILSGVFYTMIQQDLRQGANDPQIQMAEDMAAQLTQGGEPITLIPSNKVDVATSLAPFFIIYSDKGTVLASSVMLNGKTPELPAGTLDAAREGREDRFTWQPQPGVRIAAVIARYTGRTPGFVLAGRSLTEVEKREDQELGMVMLGLSAAIAGVFIVRYLFPQKS